MSRKKTASEKKLEGTARKDRPAIQETQLRAGSLQPPKGLSPVELAEWKRVGKILEDGKLVNDADRAAMADYVGAHYVAESLLASYRHGDRFYDEERRKYPLPAIILAAIKARSSSADRLGLSPAARAKVQPLPEPPDEDPLESLMRERESSAPGPM